MSSMLSLDQFAQLSYLEKKETLIAIFTQLDDQKIVPFDDVIFLLNLSWVIKESTLDTIYKNLDITLDKSKELDMTKKQLMYIKTMVLGDTLSEKEKNDANKLLDNL